MASPILLILLPLAVFLALFHPATLDVSNPGWLIHGTDNGENALGAHAYWHDQAAGVSLRTSLLNAPDGVAVLFTDSNPLVTLSVKPFAPLLPTDAQLVGPWILLCLILQVMFAWLLLRRHAPGTAALWCGVALLAFPPTLANRFIHANLMAHWTILAALWLYLKPAGRQLWWRWMLLIAVTAFIHNYLLILVGAIWAAAMLRSFWHHPTGRGALAGQIIGTLVLVVLVAWWLGAGGDYLRAGNYGAFAMPLDALWNPANQTYSNFLPAIAQREGRGFEGFQYLGLGGLMLVVGGLVATILLPGRARARAALRRLAWLVPALVVLTLLAISNRPDVAGHMLPRWSLPDPVIAALDIVRASGRLFWPVTYTLLFVSILGLFRLGRERAWLVLAGLSALQVSDLSGMAAAIRATSTAATDGRLYRRTLDPAWDPLIRNARSVAFVPGDPTRDLALYQEVAWRSVNAGRPLTSVYAARTSRATARRIVAEDQTFAEGRTIPGRLYVLSIDTSLPGALARRRRVLDGVVVIGP